MPQFMPLSWFCSIMMIVFLLFTLVVLYNHKFNENLDLSMLWSVHSVNFNFLW